MTDYSKQDIINELLIISSKPKTRETYTIDNRNYLIALLYYRFNLPEELIFLYTNLSSRSSINHAKKKVYTLYTAGDKLFLKNVDELIKKYPCDFNEFKTVTSKYTRKERIPLQLAVSIVLHKNVLKKLNNYMNVKGLSDIEEAAKKLIKSALKLWEE